MSKYKYIFSLQEELKKLNNKIDILILRGENYSHLSKRHKMLQQTIRKYKMPKFAQLFPMFFL